MVNRFLAAGKNDKPVAGIRAGTVAIWDAGPTGTDWSPAIDPLNHLSKVKFHSDFDYLRVLRVVTSRDVGRDPINLPELDIYANEADEFTLFAHGLGRVPLIIAEIENDGYRQPVAGSVFVMQLGFGGGDWRSRHIVFSADETNVYMLVRGARAPATTLHWKVFLLEEGFQTTTNPAHMLRFEPGAATIGALGKIDPSYLFARKAAGPTGDLRLLGRQSIVFDTQSNGGPVVCLNYCDGLQSMCVPSVQNFTPTPSYSFAGQECDVLAAAPDGVVSGLSMNGSGIRLRDPLGNVVFSSDWQMLAVLSHYSGTVATPSHGPTGSEATRAQEDHDLGAAPAGAQALLGWLNFGTGRNYDFSGTLINAFGLYRASAEYAVVMPYCQMFSPVMSGGRVLLRDDWFSFSDNSGAFAGAPKVTWGAQSMAYDLRAVALVGG